MMMEERKLNVSCMVVMATELRVISIIGAVHNKVVSPVNQCLELKQIRGGLRSLPILHWRWYVSSFLFFTYPTVPLAQLIILPLIIMLMIPFNWSYGKPIIGEGIISIVYCIFYIGWVWNLQYCYVTYYNNIHPVWTWRSLRLDLTVVW